MNLPTLRQLEYAVAVADQGSFSRAAAVCHVTQPGLSTQVRELEELLGVRLFERDRRGVIVTPAGADVVRRARELLTGASELAEAARGRAEPLVGPLRVGVIPTIAPYLLPSALPRVRAAYPRLKLRLREEKTHDVVDLLGRGVLDIGLLALEADTGPMHTLPLFRDEFVLAMPAGHPFSRRDRIDEKDLVGELVLLLDDGHCLRDQALAVCERVGAEETAELRATSLRTLVQMVAGGEGVTFLPQMAIAAEATRDSGVVVRPFRKPVPYRTIGLAWRTSCPRGEEFALFGHTLTDQKRTA
jgi:LysR family hydrogen peroxide-inducible transcriptional activator